MCNFFTTCNLLDTLLQHIYGCGTTRLYRQGFPDTLKNISLTQGEITFCQRGNLVASVWMDKKQVTMLSTLSQADATHTAQRRQRDGSRESVQCTDAVILYNKYMSGVDKGDQTGTPHPPLLPPPQDSGPPSTQVSRTALHTPSHQEKRRCVYCQQYRTPPQRHEVVWYCRECPGKPSLCLTG